jgi:Cu/Ag efflux protein CusF
VLLSPAASLAAMRPLRQFGLGLGAWAGDGAANPHGAGKFRTNPIFRGSVMRLKMSKFACFGALSLLAAGAGVSASSAGQSLLLAQAASPDAPKLFHGVGVITAVDPKSGLITLNHKNIPSLMEAMEMEYQSKPPKLVEGLQVGDKVDFTVDGRNLTIVDVKKSPSAK